MHINVTPNNVHHSTFGDDDTIHTETCNMSIRNVLLMVFISGELCAHVSYYRVKNTRIYMGRYSSIAAIVKNGHHSGKGIMPLIFDNFHVTINCYFQANVKVKGFRMTFAIHISSDTARKRPPWNML